MRATGVSKADANEIRDAIVLQHLSLVRAIAVRVHESLPVHVDLDDLVHAGVLGLFDAAQKYNPGKQVVFSSYAKHRIKGAILDSLRQLDWASRDLRRRHKQVEAATRELAAVLQRNPTQDKVAEKMGVGEERWRRMMLELRNVGLVSASGRSQDQEEAPAPDFPRGGDATRQHVLPRAVACVPAAGSAGPTLSLPAGGPALLHRRNDHARNRRQDGDQREPSLADPQVRAPEDGHGAAGRRDRIERRVLRSGREPWRLCYPWLTLQSSTASGAGRRPPSTVTGHGPGTSGAIAGSALEGTVHEAIQ